MNITPAIRARLVRRLRAGATIADAARAVRLPPHVVCDSVAAGARGHVFFAPLAVAHAAGLEANRRRELALVEGAARLLLAGTSIRQTAKLLRVPHGLLLSVIRRARGRAGGAPEPHLKPIADAVSARTRPGWRSCPRCKACGAPLRMTPRARRAA